MAGFVYMFPKIGLNLKTAFFRVYCQIIGRWYNKIV